MSLYHETADILSPDAAGGNLKTRIFGRKDLKSPQHQVYALALETCKWSAVLKEVIDASELLRHERKLSPLLALLLAHDFLLSKRGIALPSSHGLAQAIGRHENRLRAELTRARLRRRAASLDALRQQVAAEFASETGGRYPRWVRVNAARTTLDEQLATTFARFARVADVGDVTAAAPTSSTTTTTISTAGGGGSSGAIYVDPHVPGLVAVSPGFEFSKTEAYRSGAIILQDKASCFPAYLLDPRPEDGDVIDTCAAPGNKTTHLAAIVKSRATAAAGQSGDDAGTDHRPAPTVFAFEKDKNRSKTLDKMVKLAGVEDVVTMNFSHDFLKVSPSDPRYSGVGCMLLDPSCSGSGIVGRDAMPAVHLPEALAGSGGASAAAAGQKRKREEGKQKKQKKNKKNGNNNDDDDDDKDKNDPAAASDSAPKLVDDDGQETVVSEQELRARLEALSSFQLTLLLHAFEFPAARKVTYSTCSVHAEENEGVVMRALASGVAARRGWRVMRRAEQVRGMREWPVRGVPGAGGGAGGEVADACIRSHQGDGRGVMGFFVAGFVRDGDGEDGTVGSHEGPYARDGKGCIVRDRDGMPSVASQSAEKSRRSVGKAGVVGGRAPQPREEDSGDSEEAEAEEEEDEWDGFGD